MSGSVTVSALELEAMPLPFVSTMGTLKKLVDQGACRDAINAECNRLYDHLGKLIYSKRTVVMLDDVRRASASSDQLP